jgi:hypothetical protein
VLWSAPQSWRYCGDRVTNAAVTPSSFEGMADIRGYNDVDRTRRPLELDPESASAPAPGSRVSWSAAASAGTPTPPTLTFWPRRSRPSQASPPTRSADWPPAAVAPPGAATASTPKICRHPQRPAAPPPWASRCTPMSQFPPEIAAVWSASVALSRDRRAARIHRRPVPRPVPPPASGGEVDGIALTGPNVAIGFLASPTGLNYRLSILYLTKFDK